MRGMLIVTLCGLSLAIAASPATAQFSGGAAGSAMRQGRMEDALSRSALDRATDPHAAPPARDTQNPRRVRRAQQAAEMINNGDCVGALALANNARDTFLATRVTEICAQTTVSAPVSVPPASN